MIVEHFSQAMDKLGAAWVLYLLMFLSVVSVAVVVERLLFLRRNRVAVHSLQQGLLDALDRSVDDARALLEGLSGMPARVALSGLRNLHRGAASAEEVMEATQAIEQRRYERYLGFLGSLGSNAPFIGLLGTVIGIMGAFADLQISAAVQGAGRSQAIMGSISEALVATAVGLLVAIPAVVAYNQLRGRVQQVVADTRVLSGVVLAWLKQTPASAQPSLSAVRSEDADRQAAA